MGRNASSVGMRAVAVELVDGTTAVHLDSIVNSIPITDSFHHLGHEGNVFIHASKHASVAVGANLDTLIKVPAAPTTRQVHFNYSYTATAGNCDLTLYRDTLVSANGTAETLNSSNDAVVKTTTVEIYTGPTITNVGNIWAQGVITGGKDTAGSSDQLIPEYILTPGVNYLIRLINNSGSIIDVYHSVFFYDTDAS